MREHPSGSEERPGTGKTPRWSAGWRAPYVIGRARLARRACYQDALIGAPLPLFYRETEKRTRRCAPASRQRGGGALANQYPPSSREPVPDLIGEASRPSIVALILRAFTQAINLRERVSKDSRPRVYPSPAVYKCPKSDKSDFGWRRLRMRGDASVGGTKASTPGTAQRSKTSARAPSICSLRVPCRANS